MPFNFLLKPDATVQQKVLQIRREVVKTKPTSTGVKRNTLAPDTHGRNDRLQPLPRSGSTKRKSSPNRSKSPVKPLRRRTTPQPPINFGNDESDIEETTDTQRKKAKVGLSLDTDSKRRVRFDEGSSPNGKVDVFPMVHAADIIELDKSMKYIPAFAGLSANSEVSLQYPSTAQKERYFLAKPKFGDDDFKAVEDILQVMHTVVDHYLPEALRKKFDNEASGFPQRLNRAIFHKSEKELRTVIQEWNNSLQGLLDDGTITRVLDACRSLDLKLVERILSQACARTVSLSIKVLGEYMNGTDNVYGELLPRFVSTILKRDTRMKSDQIFVDLGSGVGNVVLQAALEIGCESWGCEMMKNYCDLAEVQQAEFQARCRLWGLAAGGIHLERGDFLTNTTLAEVLPKADVVLVNNQVFTPELNEKLTSLFLDLKDGCRIVSLKSFVPTGHKITARNLNSPYNVLQVEKKEYYSDCVSWTNAPGTYYVSTKDTTNIKAFTARNH